MIELKGKQKRYLRGLGHNLKPVVMIGKNGITEAVITATKDALLANELIKCRVLDNCEDDRKEVARQLAQDCDAALAQVLGRTFLLYIPHPEKPEIKLP